MMIAKSALRYSTLVETACLQCGLSFSTAPIYLKRGQHKYCSRACSDSARIGVKRKLSEVGIANIANSNRERKSGIRLSDSHKQRISTTLKKVARHSHTDEWRQKVSMSLKGRRVGVLTEDSRKKMSQNRRGSRNGRWKGGVTSTNHTIRTSRSYKLWRTSVFERDLYTCQACGQVGGELNADHIKPFALYPNLRLDINNGRTLCKPCHNEYGWRSAKKPSKPINAVSTI